jgi:hypothetical protein
MDAALQPDQYAGTANPMVENAAVLRYLGSCLAGDSERAHNYRFRTTF